MINEVINEMKEKFEKTISVYKEDLNGIRAGRANPALLDGINVLSYGVETAILQVASISTPEPRLLAITPWDKNLIPEIEKAILKSNLGITPSNDGTIIRLPFPELTEERRKELVKVVKKTTEDTKVALRNSRRDAMDKIKKLEKDSQITEDQKFKAEEDIEKIVDNYMKELEKILAVKEKDLLEI